MLWRQQEPGVSGREPKGKGNEGLYLGYGHETRASLRHELQIWQQAKSAGRYGFGVGGQAPGITVLARGDKGTGMLSEFFSKLQNGQVAEGEPGTRNDPRKSEGIGS